MTTELTVELPTKKEDVLTVTLDPTNNDVADTAVELIILLADELPTETLVALINAVLLVSNFCNVSILSWNKKG